MLHQVQIKCTWNGLQFRCLYTSIELFFLFLQQIISPNCITLWEVIEFILYHYTSTGLPNNLIQANHLLFWVKSKTKIKNLKLSFSNNEEQLPS